MAGRIALRTRLAAWIVAFFVRPTVRTYDKPLALATVLWTVWVWNHRRELDTGLTIACVAAMVLFVVRMLAFLETDRLPQRYHDAFARSDADELAALNQIFRLFHADPEERAAHERMRLGEEMIVRKRWAEARAALEKVDLAHFPAHSRAVVLNNLAYVTARSGNAESALAIIERAYVESDQGRGREDGEGAPEPAGHARHRAHARRPS